MMNWLAMADKLREKYSIHRDDAQKYKEAGMMDDYVVEATAAWIALDLAISIEHGALTPPKAT